MIKAATFSTELVAVAVFLFIFYFSAFHANYLFFLSCLRFLHLHKDQSLVFFFFIVIQLADCPSPHLLHEYDTTDGGEKMAFNNHFSNRSCRKCNISPCCCKKVFRVPSVVIGPIRTTGQDVFTVTPGATCGLCEYGYIYNLTPQVVAVEGDVLFDSNGIITPGIEHTLGTTQIIVSVPGDYEVTFSVSGTEDSQFALFLNNSLVPGTIYGSGAGTQQNNGQAIFTIAAGDVLTLRNHSSNAAVGLASVIGGTQSNVNASIVIKLLNPIG
jgi:hypothetical protein